MKRGQLSPSPKTFGWPFWPKISLTKVSLIQPCGSRMPRSSAAREIKTLLPFPSSLHFAALKTAVTCCPQNTIVSSSVVHLMRDLCVRKGLDFKIYMTTFPPQAKTVGCLWIARIDRLWSTLIIVSGLLCLADKLEGSEKKPERLLGVCLPSWSQPHSTPPLTSLLVAQLPLPSSGVQKIPGCMAQLVSLPGSLIIVDNENMGLDNW